MGYIVLWIENLVVALLFTALLIACIGRLHGVWRRRVWGVVVLAPIVLTYALLASVDGLFESAKNVHTGLFWPLLSLFVCYLVGAVIIWSRGMPVQPPDDTALAASWPIGKLSLALLAGLVLHMMTLANLDAAAKNSLAAVQADSVALVASVAPERVPDHKNAALIYQQAFDVLGPEVLGPEQEWPQVWRDAQEALSLDQSEPVAGIVDEDQEKLRPFDFGSDAIAQFLQSNAGAMSLLHTAAARPDCYFDKNYGRPSFDMLLPEIQHLRHAARLLAIDARHRAIKGDRKGALADINTMYGMAAHTGTEPLLVSMLVAAAIDRSAGETLQVVLGSVPATVEDLSSITIDGTASYQRLLDRAIRMEEAFVTSYFASLAGIENTPELQANAWLGFNFNQGTAPIFGPFYRVFLQAYDLASYRRFMHQHEELSGKPYQRVKSGLQELDKEFHDRPRGLLSALLTPALSAATEHVFQSDARRRVAEVALGMFRYRAAQGKFADKLADLSPQYLAVVPRDPFDNKPLKLQTTANGWIVYSLGPDLVDNQGQPFEPRTGKGDLAFEYSERSAADAAK